MTVLPVSILRNKQIAIRIQSNAVWIFKAGFERRPTIATGIAFAAPTYRRNNPRLSIYSPDPTVSDVGKVDIVRCVSGNEAWTI
ncbi:MAG: hypothetical protein M3Z32_08045 [Acidobacteriota bacterium]|nr:hypothetical protein [Acidobacteriota bacterium]